MPNKDKTGPMGEGPMTGRLLGQCENGEEQGRRGFGCGRHLHGRRFCQTDLMPKEEKCQAIKQEIADLQKELEELEK